MRRRSRILAALTALALAASIRPHAPRADACGPFFPNRLLIQGDRALLDAPLGYLGVEMDRIPRHPAPQTYVPPRDEEDPARQSVDADAREFRDLVAWDHTDAETRALVARYTAAALLARTPDAPPASPAAEPLSAAITRPVNWTYTAAFPRPHVAIGAERRLLDFLPDETPESHRLYLRALLAFRSNDPANAFALLQQFFTLKPSCRRPRDLWANYLMGRLLAVWTPPTSSLPVPSANSPADQTEGDAKAAIRIGADRASAAKQAAFHLQRVRDLAAAGNPDPLGLANAALGWQARLALDAGDLDAALSLYLRQYDEDAPLDTQSLRIVAGRILATVLDTTPDGPPPPDVLKAAADPRKVWVIAAYVVSAGGSPWSGSFTGSVPRVRAFLTLVRHRGTPGPSPTNSPTDRPAFSPALLPLADRLAWMAYQAGDYASARELAALAESDSPITWWVRSKLLLRQGETVRAADALARAVRAADTQDAWRAERPDPLDTDFVYAPINRLRGELAVLALSRSQYTEALRLLLTSGHYLDAAYIAERILTTDELIAFVGTLQPADPAPDPTRYMGFRSGRDEYALPFARAILGTRLIREGRYTEAEKYFDPDAAARARAYAAHLKAAADPAASPRAKATALMDAARISRWWGDQLMATALDPDWGALGLSFELDPTADARLTPAVPWRLAVTTPDEQSRAARTRPPTRRWHYRYVALDHARRACDLLPDNDPQLAAWLIEAGRWVSAKDPDAANPFYVALVKRCPNTPEGKSAKSLRWFPTTLPTP